MGKVKSAERIPYRTLQALETKRRIARAARKVFAEHGYATSSLEVVANEAGVAPRTVYSSFGAKKPILAAICDEWLAEADIAGFARRIVEATDPRVRLALIAELNRRQWEAGQDVVPMLEAAAASDAEVAKMLAEWKERRAGMLREAVKGIRSHLRQRITWQVAAATVRALSAAELYSELVRGEKWAPARYEAWLTELMVAQLLP